jgi:hypothetical protein
MAITEPFIIHLTVFRSRIGLANIVLPFCSLAHQPTTSLLRKVKAVVEERISVDITKASNNGVLEYLISKNMIGKTTRQRGRYRDFTLESEGTIWKATFRGKSVEAIRVYQPDLWMCHDDVTSTVGVPTPENAEECLELCYQLKLLRRNKNTITTSGLLTQALRGKAIEQNNPFLLGVELAALFKQVIATDGLMIREVVREIAKLREFTRDDLAKLFPEIVERVIVAAKPLVSPTVYKKGVQFQKLIDPIRRAKSLSKNTSSKGPGVTEHRLSPRLEWLVDFGYLSKDGLAKNSFSYKATQSIPLLLENLDSHVDQFKDNWAESVATAEWNASDCWRPFRDRISKLNHSQSLLDAYRLTKRRVGPSPISDVAFLASLFSRSVSPFQDFVDQITQLSKDNDRVTLSGGRYKQTPMNVYIPNELLDTIP